MGKKKKKILKRKHLLEHQMNTIHQSSIYLLFQMVLDFLITTLEEKKKKISLLSEPQNLNQESNKKISQSGHLFNIVEHKMAKIESQNISSHCPQNNSYIIAILCLFVSHFTAC